MGRPKLLLPIGSRSLIEHITVAWTASRVEHVMVVVHPDDVRLAELARASGAQVVVPDVPPAEMKDSVLLALNWIESNCRPTEEDVWLLAPADMPRLDAASINAVLDFHDSANPRIVVPTHGGRRGHPVLFPWNLAREVRQLSEDEGVKALLQRHSVVTLDSPTAAILADLDTPEDYERLRDRKFW